MFIFWEVPLRFGILKRKAYFGTNCDRLFLSRSFTVSSIVAIIPSLGNVLDVIEKLRSFARRSVSILVNCLEEIFYFSCYVSDAFYHFILVDQFIKFPYISVFR